MLRTLTLEDTHKRGHSTGACHDRRFVAGYTAPSGLRRGTAQPLSIGSTRAPTATAALPHMRTATLPEGTSLLEVRGWVAMVGLTQPERSGGWGIALPACGPLGV